VYWKSTNSFWLWLGSYHLRFPCSPENSPHTPRQRNISAIKHTCWRHFRLKYTLHSVPRLALPWPFFRTHNKLLVWQKKLPPHPTTRLRSSTPSTSTRDFRSVFSAGNSLLFHLTRLSNIAAITIGTQTHTHIWMCSLMPILIGRATHFLINAIGRRNQIDLWTICQCQKYNYIKIHKWIRLL